MTTSKRCRLVLSTETGEVSAVPITKEKEWAPFDYPRVGRDSQQTRVYRAWWNLKDVVEFRDMTPGECCHFLKYVTSSKWFRDRFGVVTFGQEYGRRKKTACCTYRPLDHPSFILKFPKTVKAPTALHELAHILCVGQKHGPIFCSVLLLLIDHFLGSEIAAKMQANFRRQRVSWVGKNLLA